MAKVVPFTVVPDLPDRIRCLTEIAGNFWWCWDPEAIELFFRIDRDLWVKTTQNPVRMLGEVDQERLNELARDESFLAHLDRVYRRMREYLASGNWQTRYPDAPESLCIAYFSAEFGLHESLATYSGGLGVLAGDVLKAASDLAMPLVGVGLLYREGYLQQNLTADGWQQERYPENDFERLPVTLERDGDGKVICVPVGFPKREVMARVWRCDVGRSALYLLDCDFEDNEPDDRAITARLYGGDTVTRIRQEIVLGVGGVRALRAMNIHPSVYHINEGHAAFMGIERMRQLVQYEGIELETAIEAVKASTVFTTHTPVPAGNEVFSDEMIRDYLGRHARDAGLSQDDLLALGRQSAADRNGMFSMTVLGLRLSAASVGVSRLHGRTARKMWSQVWPGVPETEVPVGHVTNGVHTRFWVSRDMAALYDRYIGPGWVRNPSGEAAWARVDAIPDAELWRTHERRRERLVDFTRRRHQKSLRARGAPLGEIQAAHEALDPEALTLAFARRFAAYKRGHLLFMDPDRLVRILSDHDRPVQLIIAGKAHPADTEGKQLIRDVVHFVRRYDVANRVVFIEDYDINVARYMVQGVDCWLNTPRRPHEASGTSGMKAAANGVLNISIPDGWWYEAQELGELGWTIGRGEHYDNPDDQDLAESLLLYQVLEREVIPAFFDRGKDGLPRGWIDRMKNAIRTTCPFFNAHRMLEQYAERFLIPCSVRSAALAHEGYLRAQHLAQWKRRVRACWPMVTFAKLDFGRTEELVHGSTLRVTVDVSLSELSEHDVAVELFYGKLDRDREIIDGAVAPTVFVEKLQGGVYRFEGAVPCASTGKMGFTARVIPSHPDLHVKHETGLVTWA